MHAGDVCDGLLLRHLFEQHNFTDVVHLAAQAGVRHSLLQPEAYVRSNAECFAVLLDTMRAWPVSLIPLTSIFHTTLASESGYIESGVPI